MLPKNINKTQIIFSSILYFIILIIFVAIDSFDIVKYYSAILKQSYFKFVLHIGFLAILPMITIFMLLSKNLIYKIISHVILFFTLTIELSYKLINNYGYTYHEANIFVTELRANTGTEIDALLSFLPQYILAIVLVFIFVTTIFFLSKKYMPKLSILHSLPLSIFVFFIMYYIVNKTQGENYYPSIFKIPALTLYATNNNVYIGKRDTNFITHFEKPYYKHVVYIIDESIRADKLGINNDKLNTSPYLNSISNKIFNYGICASGGNVSQNSQVILYSGIKESDLPNNSLKCLKNPNIFQYAKHAGYETFYIDAQTNKKHNYMTDEDFNFIDSSLLPTLKKISRPLLDYEAAKMLLDITKDSSKYTFSYIVKVGSHFHYEWNYPDSMRVFEPVSQIAEFSTDSIKRRNSYYNSLLWNTDGFFKYLIKRLLNRDIIIIYTSDHATMLGENGFNAPASYGDKVSPLQSTVPLFIYINDTLKRKNFNFVKKNINKVSHFNLFPSLLEILGYQKNEIQEYYDKSIFDSIENKRYFFTGNFFLKGIFFKNKFDK